MSDKYCPAGKCECECFYADGDETLCRAGDLPLSVYTGIEYCPWPSRQQPVEKLIRKCPMNFSKPCHEARVYDCAWEKNCPIDQRIINGIYPLVDDTPAVEQTGGDLSNFITMSKPRIIKIESDYNRGLDAAIAAVKNLPTHAFIEKMINRDTAIAAIENLKIK